MGYWLSDVSQPGRGNFHVIPGSHLVDTVEKPEDRNPDGAIPVCAYRGDAVFFDRRLWHARSPNHSPIVRKVLFYGYRWIRTKDDTTIRPDLFKNCDPIRRQLLGDGLNCNSFFSPTDEDVPPEDVARRTRRIRPRLIVFFETPKRKRPPRFSREGRLLFSLSIFNFAVSQGVYLNTSSNGFRFPSSTSSG